MRHRDAATKNVAADKRMGSQRTLRASTAKMMGIIIARHVLRRYIESPHALGWLILGMEIASLRSQ